MSFLGPMTATTSTVAATVSSVTLFSASACSGRNLYNGSTAACYVTYGTVSSTTAYSTQIAGNTNYQFPTPTYCGPVTAIWAATNGTAYTTQW